MAECSLNGLKTLCEKEKLLVTSNFSFLHSVLKNLVLQTRENQGLFGKKLNVAQMMTSFFDRVETIVGKVKKGVYQHFHLFPQHFQMPYLSGLSKVRIVW